MKEYLKMSDYIIGEVSISMNHNCDVAVSYDYADPNMAVRKTMDTMEHAINSHDELVAEVGRLRGMVIRMQTYLDMAGEYPEKESDNPVRNWMFDALDCIK